jgi:hypothetical protein
MVVVMVVAVVFNNRSVVLEMYAQESGLYDFRREVLLELRIRDTRSSGLILLDNGAWTNSGTNS